MEAACQLAKLATEVVVQRQEYPECPRCSKERLVRTGWHLFKWQKQQIFRCTHCKLAVYIPYDAYLATGNPTKEEVGKHDVAPLDDKAELSCVSPLNTTQGSMGTANYIAVLSRKD